MSVHLLVYFTIYDIKKLISFFHEPFHAGSAKNILTFQVFSQ